MHPVGLVILLLAADGGAGDLDRALVRQTVRGRTPALKACFEKQPHDSGRVVFRFVIDEDGTTSGVVVMHSDIADDDMLDCMAAALRVMKFPKHTGGPFTISYPFQFEAAQKKPPPAILQKRPVAERTVPEFPRAADIQTAMARVKSSVAACGRVHHVVATIGVAVTIEPDGTVSKVAAGPKYAKTPVGVCVEEAVRLATFRAFKGGSFTIDYSFTVGDMKAVGHSSGASE